jgi:hypothetical protein
MSDSSVGQESNILDNRKGERCSAPAKKDDAVEVASRDGSMRAFDELFPCI